MLARGLIRLLIVYEARAAALHHKKSTPRARVAPSPSPVDGLSRSSRDRSILGLAWRRAINRATTQASVHCICTAQATTHGRKTRPVAGEWCLGCVAAAAVLRRSVPSCPAVQLSHCPDGCPNRVPAHHGPRRRVSRRRRATPPRPPRGRAASPPTDPCVLPVAARGSCEPQPLSCRGQGRSAQ